MKITPEWCAIGGVPQAKRCDLGPLSRRACRRLGKLERYSVDGQRALCAGGTFVEVVKPVVVGWG